MNFLTAGPRLPLLALLAYALLYPLIAPRLGGFAAEAGPQIFFFAAAWGILAIRRTPLSSVGVTATHLCRRVLEGIALGVAPAVLTLCIIVVLTAADHIRPFLCQPLFGGTGPGASMEVSSALVLFLLAPLSEELFFRGVLLQGLRRSLGTVAAVSASAVLFMACHGGFALGPLALGLIAAPVALRTGSLVPGIVFHAISNTYTPILVEWFPDLSRTLSFLFH